MKLIAYIYDADIHCPSCTEKRFGRLTSYGASLPQDSEGNDIHPVFSIDEHETTQVCGNCGEVVYEVPPQKYTGEVGCLVGGHEGQYAVISVINIAREYGMELTTDDEGAVKEYLAGEWEFYDAGDILDSGGLGDRAEEWLNEYVAEEEYAFVWMDGEFFYHPVTWWEES